MAAQDPTKPQIAVPTPAQTQPTEEWKQKLDNTRNATNSLGTQSNQSNPRQSSQQRRQNATVQPTRQTSFREFDQVLVAQAKADAKAKQQATQVSPDKPSSLPPLPQAKPKAKTSPVQTSSEPPRPDTLSKKQTAAFVGLSAVAGSVNALREGFRRASQPTTPDTAGWQVRLGTGFHEWGKIRGAYTDLDEVKTVEDFDVWLKSHPEAMIDGKKLTLADWKFREDYYEYDRLLREEDAHAHQEHKEKAHKGEHPLAPVLHQHDEDTEETSHNSEKAANPTKTTTPSPTIYTPPPRKPVEWAKFEPNSPYLEYQRNQQARYKALGVDSRPVFAGTSNSGFNAFSQRASAFQRSVPVETIEETPEPIYDDNAGGYEDEQPEQSPSVSNSHPVDSPEDDGQTPPPPAFRGGSGGRGIPGVGGAVNLGRSALNFTPAGRVANVVIDNRKKIIGIIAGGIFFFLMLFTMLGDTGDAQPTVDKQTANTTVENSDCSAVKSGAETAVSIGPFGSLLKAGLDLFGKDLNCNKLGSETNEVINESHLLAQGNTTAVLGSSDKAVLSFGNSGTAAMKAWMDKVAKSTITYSITASYPGQADDIKVTDSIPSNGLFLQASGICHLIYTGSRVTGVWWSVKENQGVSQTEFSDCGYKLPGSDKPTPTPTPEKGTGVRGTSTTAVDFNKYTKSPYNLPAPSGTSDVNYPNDLIAAMNTEAGFVAKHQSYLTSRTGGAQYVDPFLSVIWTGAVEGIGANPSYWSNGNPYFWNCLDNGDHNISHGCAGGFSSGGWQVGYGMQVSQAASHVADDFNEAYGAGAANNPQKVQQVGQAVINNAPQKITNPSTFPAQPLQQIAQAAIQGNQSAQQALAIILMDRELGAIVMAREIASDIAARNNWSSTMSGWGGFYSSNMQNFSNRAAALAKGYTGTVTSGSGSSGTSTSMANATFQPITFFDKVLPLVKDDNFTSGQATVEVIGGRGGAASSSASPSGSTGSGSSSGVGCTKVVDPPGSDWAKVNSRDEIIKQKVLEVQQNDGPSNGVCIPVNLVKALVYEESGGEMLPVNGAGYGGIMQVGVGSNCDHSKYDIYTLEGNVGCGISHLTRGYVECGSWEGTITAYYAGHCTPNGAADDPNLGGSGETDFQYRDRIINRWHQMEGQ